MWMMTWREMGLAERPVIWCSLTQGIIVDDGVVGNGPGGT